MAVKTTNSNYDTKDSLLAKAVEVANKHRPDLSNMKQVWVPEAMGYIFIDKGLSLEAQQARVDRYIHKLKSHNNFIKSF